MWSVDLDLGRLDLRRVGLAIVVASTTSVLVAGCTTFRPLYADVTPTGIAAGPGQGVGRLLPRIAISNIPEREGNQLRNDLIFVLSGGGREPENAEYRLDVTVATSATGVVIEALSGRPTSAQVHMTASYTLVRVQGSERVFTGRASARASFDRGVQRFANIRAQRDAEDRAARELAEMIRNGLAGHFARQPGG